jgi:hypothetical protein
VHEIERSIGQRVAGDVVAKDLEIRSIENLEELCIDVRDDDPAAVADPLTQPAGNRSASTSHLQTLPTDRQPAIHEMAFRARIEDGG